MEPRVTWHRVRDGITGILSAGVFGMLLYMWLGGSAPSQNARLEEAVADKLQQLQAEVQGGGAEASRQRMAAIEAELARLQSSKPAEARARSQQEMQRWLEQRAPERPRENASGRTFALLLVMAAALLGLNASRWFPLWPRAEG